MQGSSEGLTAHVVGRLPTLRTNLVALAGGFRHFIPGVTEARKHLLAFAAAQDHLFLSVDAHPHRLVVLDAQRFVFLVFPSNGDTWTVGTSRMISQDLFVIADNDFLEANNRARESFLGIEELCDVV